MRLWHRSFAVALVAPMLALAVSAYGFIGLRCRATGMVSIATCCPRADSQKVPAHSSVDDPGCCERVVVANAKPPGAAADPARQLAAQPASVAVPVLHAPVVIPFYRTAPSFDPPDPYRPPLRLVHRSLLI